jgi:hypothetical protein
MPDQEGDRHRDPRVPGELFRSTESHAAADVAAALGSLDRATADFTRRLEQGSRDIERVRAAAERAIAEEVASAPSEPEEQLELADESGFPAAPPAPRRRRTAKSPKGGEAAVERRMRAAEEEARAYLDGAKRRADSLVASMIGAVEQEAAEIRRSAEEGVRARWRQVEVDADRHVENARRVADRMVAERQRRIAALSEGITERAGALTAGMEDADRVRAQFDHFVRALSAAADQIARSASVAERDADPREHPAASQPSAMAA